MEVRDFLSEQTDLRTAQDELCTIRQEVNEMRAWQKTQQSREQKSTNEEQQADDERIRAAGRYTVYHQGHKNTLMWQNMARSVRASVNFHGALEFARHHRVGSYRTEAPILRMPRLSVRTPPGLQDRRQEVERDRAAFMLTHSTGVSVHASHEPLTNPQTRMERDEASGLRAPSVLREQQENRRQSEPLDSGAMYKRFPHMFMDDEWSDDKAMRTDGSKGEKDALYATSPGDEKVATNLLRRLTHAQPAAAGSVKHGTHTTYSTKIHTVLTYIRM